MTSPTTIPRAEPAQADLFGIEHPKATGLLFLRGRLKFCYLNGKPASTAGAPSVLVAYGQHDADILASQPWPGHYVPLGGTR